MRQIYGELFSILKRNDRVVKWFFFWQFELNIMKIGEFLGVREGIGRKIVMVLYDWKLDKVNQDLVDDIEERWL